MPKHQYRWCVIVTPYPQYLKKIMPFVAYEARETEQLVFAKHERFTSESRYHKSEVRPYWFDDKPEAMIFAKKLNQHLNLDELVRLRNEQAQRERVVREQIVEIVENGLNDES